MQVRTLPVDQCHLAGGAELADYVDAKKELVKWVETKLGRPLNDEEGITLTAALDNIFRLGYETPLRELLDFMGVSGWLSWETDEENEPVPIAEVEYKERQPGAVTRGVLGRDLMRRWSPSPDQGPERDPSLPPAPSSGHALFGSPDDEDVSGDSSPSEEG